MCVDNCQLQHLQYVLMMLFCCVVAVGTFGVPGGPARAFFTHDSYQATD